jgi:hypothetical protein
MFKRGISAPVVPALLLFCAPALAATSAAGKSHKVDLSGLIDTVSSKGTVGVAGATETDAGTIAGAISGKATGQGAFYQNVTWRPGLQLLATGAAFDASGSVRFKLTAKFVAGPAGAKTLTYSGTATVTGGTGAFTNAHGTLTVSGVTLTADPDAATIKMTGTLTY